MGTGLPLPVDPARDGLRDVRLPCDAPDSLPLRCFLAAADDAAAPRGVRLQRDE